MLWKAPKEPSLLKKATILIVSVFIVAGGLGLVGKILVGIEENKKINEQQAQKTKEYMNPFLSVRPESGEPSLADLVMSRVMSRIDVPISECMFCNNEAMKSLGPEFNNRYCVLCEVYKEAHAAGAQVFSYVEQNKKFPLPFYTFSIFESRDDSGVTEKYAKKIAGIFSDLATCSRLRAKVDQVDVGTSRCVKWVEK